MKQKYDLANQAYQELQKEFGKAGPGGIHQHLPNPPAWPEPTALPPDDPVISLQAPAPVTVALRAQVPAVVRLRGRPELVFSRAGVTLTAKPLKRNLALETWGTAVSEVPADPEFFAHGREFRLPGVQRISVLACRPDTEFLFRAQEGGKWRTVVPVWKLYANIETDYNVVDQTVETDAVQLWYNGTVTSTVLLSESAPMRVMLAAGDDTPLQSFPSAVPAGESVVSRDLSGDLNRAWAGATPVAGGLVEIQLKITSLTDGLAEVKLAGDWQRQLVQPAADLQLNPFHPKSFTVPWLPAAAAGSVTVTVEGEFSTGPRQGLAEQAGAGRPFAVRVTENLAIAQAVLLRGGGGTGPARMVTAVWLALPAVPLSAQTVELRLAGGAGDPVAPAEGAPLARAEATLPADAAAYIATEPGGPVWYRVALDKPVALDGTASGQPFFLVGAGREGTKLLHRSNAVAARLPAQPGPGCALVRNLAWASDWEEQQFDRSPARWVFDLELAPLPGEALLTVNGQPVALTDGKGAYKASVAVQPGHPAPPSVIIPMAAGATGALKVSAQAVAPA